RLHVLPIHLPPLRERPEDLPPLARHLMERLRRQGLHPPELGAGAVEAMRRYHWPGNVRELGNVCERLAILYPGGRVDAPQVEEQLPGSRTDTLSLVDRLDAFEREQILAALAAAGWSMAEAARRLETDRANLYRRMKRLGIE